MRASYFVLSLLVSAPVLAEEADLSGAVPGASGPRIEDTDKTLLDTKQRTVDVKDVVGEDPLQTTSSPVTTPGLAPAREVNLRPIVTEGTPYEALKFDPVVPSLPSKTTKRSTSGGLAKDIANNLPFHLSDNTRAGNVVNLTGNVRTAEEIDVNVLGVPLNAPQGGGFNLTSFPQYLWSGFNFQIGPSLGAYDPRGIAGSLSLRLWTQDALNDDESKVQVSGFHSSLRIQQLSAAWDKERKYAFLAGHSFGKVKGPAGSFAARLYEDGNWRVKFYSLATDQTVDEFLSERATLATADYRVVRAIPLLQVDRNLGADRVLKTSFFYDTTYLKTDDPTAPLPFGVREERSKARQGGLESTLLQGPWRLGLGLRQTHFKRLTFSAPRERLANAQVTYGWKKNEWIVEPTVGATAITRFGTRPMATLGVRRETDLGETTTGQFVRTGWHYRFPSLLDRYSTYNPGGLLLTVPNPDLKEERVLSVEVGADVKRNHLNASLTTFARKSRDARFYSEPVLAGMTVVRPGRVINNGDAYQFGAIASLGYSPLAYLDFTNRTAFQKGRYETAHRPFSYLPNWVSVFGIDVHDANNRYGIEATQKLATRFRGGSETATAVELPGYGYLDLTARAQLIESLTLMAGVDNVFDKDIQFRQNQRSFGRLYTVSVIGIF